MKAQMKAIIASVVVIALALAAVSGVTYSWFSDTENSNISVSSAKIDIEGKYTTASVIKTTDPNYSDVITYVDPSSIGSKELIIKDVVGDRTITASYELKNLSTVKTNYRMYVYVDGLTDELAKDFITITTTSFTLNELNFSDGISYLIGSPDDGIELRSKTIDTGDVYTFTVSIAIDQMVTTLDNFSIKIVNEAYQSDYSYLPAQILRDGSVSMPTGGTITSNVTLKGTAPGESESVENAEVEVIFSPGAANVATNNGTEAVTLQTKMLESEGSVAKIDLTLIGGSSTFNGNWVTVTVTVPGSYDSLDVYYNGTSGDQPQVLTVIADGSNTKVTFRTNHFSEYEIVESYTVVNDEAGLVKAVEDGFKTIYVSETISVTNTENLNLNGTTVKAASNSIKTIIELEHSITISNGTISNNTSIEKDSRVLNVDGKDKNLANIAIVLNNVNIIGPEQSTGATYTRGISFWSVDGASLTVSGGSISASYYAINISEACPNFTLIVSDSTVSAGWCAYQTHSVGTNASFTDSHLIGINDKEYNSEGWNNFATIVINGKATDSVLTLTRCTVEANQETGNDQDLFSFRSTGTECTATETNFMVNGQTASLEGLKNIGVYYTGNTISLNGMTDWYKTASTYPELKQYLEGGYYCSLTEHIDMKSEVADVSSAIIIPEGVYSALDFNGFNITVTERNGIKILGILDVYDLSDSGTGGMKSTGGTYDNGEGNPVLLWAYGSGDLFIYGGNYHSGDYGQCVYASPGSEIIIDGGKFHNEQLSGIDTKYGYIINQANVSKQLISVYEGTFIGYDPAQGDDKKGSGSPQSFLVDGSTSTKSEGSETWVVKYKY